jgi:hypothetical protein
LHSVHWIRDALETNHPEWQCGDGGSSRSDLALVELSETALRAATASHKLGDVFRLRLKMIELEHELVRKPAVDAPRFAKALQHDADVASVGRHTRARELHLTMFSECQLVMCQALTRRVVGDNSRIRPHISQFPAGCARARRESGSCRRCWRSSSQGRDD